MIPPAQIDLGLIVVAILAALLLAILLAIFLKLSRFITKLSRQTVFRLFKRSPKSLAARLGLTLDELATFTPTYRTVEIPKRSGGMRTLHIPDPATKRIQRLVLRRVLRNLRSHRSAHAYEQGHSIVTNARAHVGRQYLLKFDLHDFFPSTTQQRIELYFRRIGWNRAAAQILTRLTTREGGLPQGAPTSPRLSNLVNFKLDHVLHRCAARWHAAYTRYADDITISLTIAKPRHRSRILMSLRQSVFRAARAAGYKVHRSPKKLRLLQQHHRQTVTGLVVNQKVQLSRKQRRLLRAAEHRQSLGQPTTLTAAQIQGWRALQSMIENQR